MSLFDPPHLTLSTQPSNMDVQHCSSAISAQISISKTMWRTVVDDSLGCKDTCITFLTNLSPLSPVGTSSMDDAIRGVHVDAL